MYCAILVRCMVVHEGTETKSVSSEKKKRMVYAYYIEYIDIVMGSISKRVRLYARDIVHLD